MSTPDLKTPPVTPLATPLATPPVTSPVDSTQKSDTVADTAKSTRTLSTEPVTDEMFEKAASKSVRSSIRAMPVKPTNLAFGIVEEQPHVARCQLVLCNISDRVLYFRLKSSGGSNIVSIPFGNGHIAPHAQIRLTLTWTRDVMKYKEWKDVPQPKLILVSKFLDINQADVEETSIRLTAKIGTKKCSGGVPPTEQLLLDANPGAKPEALGSPTPQPASNFGQQLADFVNNLSDRGIVALILMLAIIVIIFTDSRQR